MSGALPGADDLFRKYFEPYYPPDRPPAHRGVASDIEEIELPPGTPISVLQVLEPDPEQQVQQQLAGMDQAFRTDWASLLGVEAPVNIDWIAAFEKHFDQAATRDLLGRSEPENFSNPFLIMCCECGCAIAAVLREQRPALQWLHDWPYWDSALFDLNSKLRLNVFHWAIKRLSGDFSNESLVEKIEASVSFMESA